MKEKKIKKLKEEKKSNWGKWAIVIIILIILSSIDEQEEKDCISECRLELQECQGDSRHYEGLYYEDCGGDYDDCKKYCKR